MTHAQLVKIAVEWLRRSYGCGIVLSEQSCCTGEMPDAIGWKRRCRSVVVECKVSRADFFADAHKPWRRDADMALGCERLFLVPHGLISADELPPHWGLLEYAHRRVSMTIKPARQSLRSAAGLMNEMNLLLFSLRRVEVRIEPQTITDFLKWKNRLVEYNGGVLPRELAASAEEPNPYLDVVEIF